ncbi:oxidoreductase [Salinirubellus salinus]|uniref:phosphoglycerol geranylgeranyltransferase n=1 Tax=Salinirubellus salinus TaxID=1364945 RepID=A0A9E7U906_9EURY|nr:geranylgeranylglyceryl/heptaprenylglyceryl phosphate synthase [Salinirubellus salinus]UWM55411.1 oxidoreductase [Salinirubellus salinus]
MNADEFAVRVGRAVETARLGVRAFLPVDTNRVPAAWTHVTKVDPEEAKRLPLAYPFYLGHTSAVSVGGSADVTGENTEETFRLLEYGPVPAIHEPSGPRHVTDATRDACHFLAVPEVLNGDSEALIGTLGAGAEYIRDELAPSEIREKLPWLPGFLRDRLAEFATGWLLADAVFEAYIIQNPDSAAAREGGVDPEDVLEADEAGRRALAAEMHLESDLIYLEYSGTFGGADAAAELEAIDANTNWSRVWYGGGLDSFDRVERVREAGADAVVVGDVFHDVAEAELELREAAREGLDADAGRADVEAFVDERFDPEGAPVRYLDTCGVREPERVAKEYLVLGVEISRALETGDVEVVAGTYDGVLDSSAARRLAKELERTVDGEAAADDAFGHLGL